MLGIDTRAARVLWTILLFVAALGLVYLLRRVLLLLAFAVVFAYLVFPLVRLVERWHPLRGRRGLAVGLVYLVLVGVLAGAGAAVGPRLSEEAAAFARRAPEVTQQLQSGEMVGNFAARRGWTLPIDEINAYVRAHMQAWAGHAQQVVGAVAGWLAGAWVVVLVPIFAFFFLKDGERFTRGVEATLETRLARGLWRDIAGDVHHLLGQYVRALIVLCLVTFVVWSAVFFLAGVRYALLLAALGGIMEFIPLVGPVIAAAIVLAVNLFGGEGHPWLLLGFLAAWRLIQDYATSPLVMGSGVELHPALVIFGVIAGGEIGGVAGMFFSIPVLAALRIVWRRLRALPPVTSSRAA